MTDFSSIELTVASTRGDCIHNIGFHVYEKNLEELREIVRKHDPNIQLRVEKARNWTPDESAVKWVWIRLNDNTSWKLLRELSQAVRDQWLYPEPREFP